MSEIKHSRNIIEILNEIENDSNKHKRSKTKSKFNGFLFFPLMDIDKKFKISNKFDKKHSKKFLKEKDIFLEVVELDDRLPEEIGESQNYEISNIDLLNFTFGI